MSQDISHILEGWDFDPHELNVRLIEGHDGVECIQMRIHLGLLQMSVTGRPDGQRPNGCESLLEYYEHEAQEYGEGYWLSNEAIDELFREGWQYYHRYLCLFHLGRYEEVIRDTDRILRLFAFVRAHAKKKRDQWRFDQYRPYVIMMHTRARAMLSLDAGDRSETIAAIDAGRLQVESFLREHGRKPDDTDCFELEFLKRWLREISGCPDALRRDLEEAIAREDYESAASLRDQIKNLENLRLNSQD